MKARLIAADPAHIPHLAAGMREADKREVWAWSRSEPAESLERSLAGSVLAWTGTVDGEPVCMFGAGAEAMLSPVASPWLLGTDVLERIPAAFGRLSLVGLHRMAAAFPVLANWSDGRHERAHRWLQWLGFTLGEARPMGALGLPFRPFAMRCRHV